MRRIFHSLIVIVILSASIPTTTKASVDPFSAETVGIGLDLLVGSIDDKIEKRINQVFDRFDMSVVRTRTNTEALVVSAQVALSEILNMTFNELTDQQTTFVTNWFRSLQEADRLLSEQLGEVEQLSLTVASLVDEIEPFTDAPLVVGMDIEQRLIQGSEQEITVIWAGINLRHDKAFAEYNGKQIALQFPTDNEARSIFTISDDTSGTQSIRLVLVRDTWCIWIIGCLFSEEETYAFNIYPHEKVLGELAPIYLVDTFPVVPREISGKGTCKKGVSLSNPTGGRCRAYVFNPRNVINANSGYNIVTDSITKEPYHCSEGCSNSTYEYPDWFQVTNITQRSFVASAFCRSENNRRCNSEFRITYLERQIAPEVKRVLAPRKTFSYLEDGVSWELPIGASLQGFELTITDLDGNPISEAQPVARMSDVFGIRTYWTSGETIVEVVPQK